MAADHHIAVPYTKKEEARIIRRAIFRKAKNENGAVEVTHRRVA